MKKFLFLIIFIFILASCLPQTNTDQQQVDSNQNKTKTPLEMSSPEPAETPLDISGYIDIKPAQALELLDAENLVVIDVSPHYDEGHLPGAVQYYLGDGSLDKAIPNLDKSKDYLVYCHVDSVAIAGAEKLVDAGFKMVYRLVGNYPGWLDLGYPVEVSLSAVGIYSGQGRAIRSYYNNQFSHQVIADLTDPAQNKFYEGWLVSSAGDFFSTGKMEKNNQGQYKLNYSDSEDKTDFNQVVITEETLANGLDNKPEAHVLEGEF